VFCAGQVSLDRDEIVLLILLACGLVLAAVIGAAWMRKGTRWVIAAGAAWAVLPLLFGVMFFLGYELFSSEEHAMLFGAVIGAVLTGALFGAAYARWGNQPDSGGRRIASMSDNQKT